MRSDTATEASGGGGFQIHSNLAFGDFVFAFVFLGNLLGFPLGLERLQLATELRLHVSPQLLLGRLHLALELIVGTSLGFQTRVLGLQRRVQANLDRQRKKRRWVARTSKCRQ